VPNPPSYVELHARSAFSFLRGTSHPDQLASRAAELDLPAVALTDRDGLYGTPRLHNAAKGAGVRPIVGAELSMEDGSVLPVLVRDKTGYKNLCRLITHSKLQGTKGNSAVLWSDLNEHAKGLSVLTGDEEGPVRQALASGDKAKAEAAVQRLCLAFGRNNVFIEMQRPLTRGEAGLHKTLADLAESVRLPLLATGGVLYATPDQRPVLDVFTCARHRTRLDSAGRLLSQNDQRHLRPARQMEALFSQFPEALKNTVLLASQISFSLDQLEYRFPEFPVPAGESMDTFLRKVTISGARARYSHLGSKVLAQLDHELRIISSLGFAGYFLIVWDLVNFCSSQNILVQGRGSAANSAVCYSLGITACDPIACGLLFERFLSEGRTTWPDIDLDLPSGARRERVIQEVYRRYGTTGAAMTANVITFRGKGAMREIGKALDLPEDILGRFSALHSRGEFSDALPVGEQLRQAGLPDSHPRASIAADLYARICGLPRHLGQHSGGMLISAGKLSEIVPLERASMEGRIVAQWDKYDCESLGIIKVDLLGLGMMAALQDSIELCARRNRPVDLAGIPKDDAATFELMSAADTVGVFQIESRAQMATLPRMKPRCFYDVVVEVAIIRPGPIQGDMVHPYLARRAGKEPVSYIHEDLAPVLERTLGVPLFQEQLLRMAMVMADFSAAEAEELRRALSDYRSAERMERVCRRLREKMGARGHSEEITGQVLKSMRSFALYGFPESHAISFALIAYASAWMKVHRAHEFYAALLNNQPMGFYSSNTLIQDARRRGVRMLPVSAIHSEWCCTVEPEDTVRLGLCLVRGLALQRVEKMLAARKEKPFENTQDFQRRAGLNQNELRSLASIGALGGLSTHRREALWQVEAPLRDSDLFSCTNSAEGSASPLPPMTPEERLGSDFSGTGLTTGPHPMALLRRDLPDAWTAFELKNAPHGVRVQTAGMVICRQRPGTAKGFFFLSLEDETGVANVILSPALFERHRLLVSQETFLIIEGTVQQQEGITNLRADRVLGLHTRKMNAPESHDFR
jgi:error-prone DNA polymerase